MLAKNRKKKGIKMSLGVYWLEYPEDKAEQVYNKFVDHIHAVSKYLKPIKRRRKRKDQSLLNNKEYS